MNVLMKEFAVDRSLGERVQSQIEAFLRHQVWSGRIKPGDRLPSTHELTRRWGVNLVSVQKAMERLTEYGLLERKTKSGTIVRPLAIGILPQQDLAQEKGHYSRALAKALREEVGSHGWMSEVYDDFWIRMKFDRVEESPGARRLFDDLAARRFSGLVLLGAAQATCALLPRRTDLPWIHCSQWYRTADVMNDYYRFIYDSVEYLAKRGRRRIEIIGVHEQAEEFAAALAAAARFDLPRPGTNPYEGDLASLQDVSRQTLALLERWKREGRMPDGLIVSDDIAMQGVALALVQKGVAVPQKMDVVTQANVDVQIDYGLPVVRYAFTPKRNAEYALDLLWKKIVHEPLPDRPILLAGRMLEP